MCIRDRDKEEAKNLYDVDCLSTLPKSGEYSAIIIAVAHNEFKELKVEELKSLLRDGGILYDVKSIFSKDQIDGAL